MLRSVAVAVARRFAHLGMDVEVPVALEAPLLALCVVEQEAVFDDEESFVPRRQ